MTLLGTYAAFSCLTQGKRRLAKLFSHFSLPCVFSFALLVLSFFYTFASVFCCFVFSFWVKPGRPSGRPSGLPFVFFPCWGSILVFSAFTFSLYCICWHTFGCFLACIFGSWRFFLFSQLHAGLSTIPIHSLFVCFFQFFGVFLFQLFVYLSKFLSSLNLLHNVSCRRVPVL